MKRFMIIVGCILLAANWKIKSYLSEIGMNGFIFGPDFLDQNDL